MLNFLKSDKLLRLFANNKLSFFIIFCSGLILKSINLTSSGFWYDETWTVFVSQRSFQEILDIARWDQNPPLYNFIISLWIKLFGISEFAVRYFSVIVSSLTGGLIYLFAKKHIDLKTAIFAATIFLVSNVNFYYSHEARSYALIVLLCVSSVYLFFEILEKRNIYKLIGLGVINAAIVYTHYIPIFLLIVEFIYAVVLLKRNKWGLYRYVFSQLISILLFLPWLKIAINIYLQTNKQFWLGKPNLNDLKQLLIDFAMGLELVYIYSALIIYGIIILFFKNNIIHKNQKNFFYFLLLWSFFPIISDYFLSFVTPSFLPRYLLYSSIGLILLISYIISNLPIKSILKYLLIFLIAIISVINFEISPLKNQDFRTAVSFLKGKQIKNSKIILSASSLDALFAYYYNRKFFIDYTKLRINLTNNNIILMDDTTGINKLNFNSVNQIILIQSFEGYSDPKGTLIQFLDSAYLVQSKNQFSGVKVNIYYNRR